MQWKSWLCSVPLTLLATLGVAHAQYKDAIWIHGGNEAVVNHVVFSPNSKYVSATTGDGAIKIWEVATSNLYRVILGGAVSTAFTPGGDTIAAANRDGSIKLWRISTGEMIRSFTAHAGQVNSVSYSRDGRRLASGGADNLVKLWDTYTGTLIKTFTGHTGIVNQVSFAPDGNSIASASDDFYVRLWNVTSGDTIKTFRWRDLVERSVTFSNDGKYIAAPAGSCDGAHGGCGAIVFDVSTGKIYRRYDYTTNSGRHNLEVLSVAFSSDGNFLASGSRDKSVFLYRLSVDSTNYNKPAVIRANAAVNSVAFSPDGQYLAAGSDDKTVRLRNLVTGDTTTLIDVSNNIHAVALTKDGNRIIAGDDFGRVKVWDVASGNLVRVFKAHTTAVQGVAASPIDADRFASASVDGRIKEWRIGSGVLIDSIPASGTQAAFNAIVYSSDAQSFLTGQAAPDSTVKLWNAGSGGVTSTYVGNSDGVKSVAFSTDGKYVASGGLDFSVHVWDKATRVLKFVKTDHTAPVNAVAFSPDGKYLASAGDDKTIRVYSLPLGTSVTTFTQHSNNVTALAFTPDNYLVSASEDQTVRVWKIATEENVYTYGEYPSEQLSLAVSADRIVSGTADGSVILWQLKTGGGVDLSTPLLISPPNNSIDQPTAATLQWHSVTGAVSYTVQVATDSTFVSGIAFEESGIADTMKTVGTLAPNKKFFWRVKAQGGSGSSPWSAVWNFTTNSGGPPAPALASPDNKSKNVPISVTFQWQATPGANRYKLQVAKIATFSTGVKSADLDSVTLSYTMNNLDPTSIYYWRVSAFNSIGQGPWSTVWSFTTQGVNSVEEPSRASNSGYVLEQSLPNPFTSSAMIRFTLPVRAQARLSIVDESGREVALLLDKALDAGTHSATLDGSELSAGTYFSRLDANGIVLTRKMVLVK